MNTQLLRVDEGKQEEKREDGKKCWGSKKNGTKKIFSI